MSSYEAMRVEARLAASRAALTSTDSVSYLMRSDEKLSGEKSQKLLAAEEKRETRKMKKARKRYKKSMLVMSPQKPTLQRWEAVMMMLLCYTALVTPLEVGFFTPKFNGLFYVNIFVTTCFFIDLVLNFFTAVIHPRTGHLVYNQAYITKRYLKTWFIVDLLSCIPFDALYLGVGSSAFSQLGVLRTLRLLRLVKLARVLRVNRIYKRIELVYTVDYSLIELLKFGMTTVVFAHWMACGLGLIEDMESSTHSWSRLTEFSGVVVGPEGAHPRDVVGPLRLYLAALYWSTMTISTIGYGDIVPVTSAERIYVIIAMLIGAFEYGYIVGAVSNVIATRNEKLNKFQAMMRDLNGFLTDHMFPQKLRVRLREYFKYQLEGTDADVYKKLLAKMSPALRGECTILMNTWIKKVDFFRDCPEPMVIQLSTCVVEHTYPPEESLFFAGETLRHAFLIRKGVVDAERRIHMSGKIIAEGALYYAAPILFGARALTYAEIYTLKREDFHAALEGYPATKKYFKLRGVKKIFSEELLAYTKAWRALKELGVDADLSDEVSDRPTFYLKKLRMIYGDDGEGLENPRILEQKTRAAIIIQKRFRGMLHRVMMHQILVERGVHGIFHKVLRERDPMSYTARAIDVFHSRLGFSLTEVHRKLNSILDHSGIQDDPTSVEKPSTLISTALQAAAGKAMTVKREAGKQAPVTTASQREQPVDTGRAAGWGTSSLEDPIQTLQSRVDELTSRLVPLERKITNANAKQTAALAETNERLSELTSQLEALMQLTVSSMESGLADARTQARIGRRERERARELSPPPSSTV